MLWVACFTNNNISQEILQEDYLRSLQHIAVSKDVMNFCVSDIEKLVKYAQQVSKIEIYMPI